MLSVHLLLILGPGSPGGLPAGQWGEARPVIQLLRSAQDKPTPRAATVVPGALAQPSGPTEASTTESPAHTRSAAPTPTPTPAPAPAPAPALAPAPAPTAAPAPPAAATSASLPEAGVEADRDVLGWQASNLRIPPAQTLVYALSGRSRAQPFHGEAELDWRHDGQQYEAHLRQRGASGLREMSSTGRLTAEGLTPDRFSDRSQGRGELAAHFEPATGLGATVPPQEGAGGARVRFSGNQPDAELPAGAQDRLSVVMQLAARVAGLGRPLRTGETLDFPVATARAGGTWRFRYEGTVWLPGPGGNREALREALHLRRRPEGPHDLDIELWLAPDLDYLPLQWRLAQDNGDWLEQRWTGDYRP